MHWLSAFYDDRKASSFIIDHHKHAWSTNSTISFFSRHSLTQPCFSMSRSGVRSPFILDEAGSSALLGSHDDDDVFGDEDGITPSNFNLSEEIHRSKYDGNSLCVILYGCVNLISHGPTLNHHVLLSYLMRSYLYNAYVLRLFLML